MEAERPHGRRSSCRSDVGAYKFIHDAESSYVEIGESIETPS
jgi:hypothetical protein